jgi:molybdopterin molybdotransferase
LQQGGNYVKGHVLVQNGRRIRAQELAALCEAGVTELVVTRELTMAVLATGNELVSAYETPGAGEIRNSNEPMLLAQIKQAHGMPIALGVARDELEEIRVKVQTGLKEDILLLTGGVSAGTLDLVPRVLKEEGVRQVLHKVSLKPGKPIWFGVKEVDGHKTYVFGLPGNPVSSMICFEIFVKPLMKKLSGLEDFQSHPCQAIVKNSYRFRSDRPTYHPVKCFWEHGVLYAEILNWTGSSDLTSTVLANGTGIFEAGEREYHPGEKIEVLMWE